MSRSMLCQHVIIFGGPIVILKQANLQPAEQAFYWHIQSLLIFELQNIWFTKPKKKSFEKLSPNVKIVKKYLFEANVQMF